MALSQVCPGDQSLYASAAGDDADTIYIGYSGPLDCARLLALSDTLDGVGGVVYDR